jgi:hypothetical protein
MLKRPVSVALDGLSERSSTMSDFLFVILSILWATAASEPVIIIVD